MKPFRGNDHPVRRGRWQQYPEPNTSARTGSRPAGRAQPAQIRELKPIQGRSTKNDQGWQDFESLDDARRFVESTSPAITRDPSTEEMKRKGNWNANYVRKSIEDTCEGRRITFAAHWWRYTKSQDSLHDNPVDAGPGGAGGRCNKRQRDEAAYYREEDRKRRRLEKAMNAAKHGVFRPAAIPDRRSHSPQAGRFPPSDYSPYPHPRGLHSVRAPPLPSLQTRSQVMGGQAGPFGRQEVIPLPPRHQQPGPMYQSLPGPHPNRGHHHYQRGQNDIQPGQIGQQDWLIPHDAGGGFLL